MRFTGEKARVLLWDCKDKLFGLINALEYEQFAYRHSTTGHSAMHIQIPYSQENINFVTEQKKRLENYYKEIGAPEKEIPYFFKVREMSKLEYSDYRNSIIRNKTKQIVSNLPQNQRKIFNKYFYNKLTPEKIKKFEKENQEFKIFKEYIEGKLSKEDSSKYEDDNFPEIKTNKYYDIHCSFYSSNKKPYYSIVNRIYRDNIYARKARDTSFLEAGKMLFEDDVTLRVHKDSLFKYSPMGNIHKTMGQEKFNIVQALLKDMIIKDRLSSIETLIDKLDASIKKHKEISKNTLALITQFLPRLLEKSKIAIKSKDNSQRTKELKFIKTEAEKLKIKLSEVEKLNKSIFSKLNNTEIYDLKNDFINYYNNPEQTIDLPLDKFDTKLMIIKMIDEMTDYEAFELRAKNCSTTTANIIIAGLQNNKNKKHLNNVFRNEVNVWTIFKNPTSILNATERIINILNGKEPTNFIRTFNEKSLVHVLSKYFNLDVALLEDPPYRRMDLISGLKVPKFIKENKEFNLLELELISGNRYNHILKVLNKKEKYKDVDSNLIEDITKHKYVKKYEYDGNMPKFDRSKRSKLKDFIKILKLETLSKKQAMDISKLCWKLSISRSDIDLITKTNKNDIKEQINTLNFSNSDKEILKALFDKYKRKQIEVILDYKSKYLKAWQLREEAYEILAFFRLSNKNFESIRTRRRIMLGAILLPSIIYNRIINPLGLYKELNALSDYAFEIPVSSANSRILKVANILLIKPLSYLVAPLAAIQYMAKETPNIVRNSYKTIIKTLGLSARKKKQIPEKISKEESTLKSNRNSILKKAYKDREKIIDGDNAFNIIEALTTLSKDQLKNDKIITLSKKAMRVISDNSSKKLPSSGKLDKTRDTILEIALSNEQFKDKLNYKINRIVNNSAKKIAIDYNRMSNKLTLKNHILRLINNIKDDKSGEFDKVNNLKQVASKLKSIEKVEEAVYNTNINKTSSALYMEINNLKQYIKLKNEILDNLNNTILKKENLSPQSTLNYNSLDIIINAIELEYNKVSNSNLLPIYKNFIQDELSALLCKNKEISNAYVEFNKSKNKELKHQLDGIRILSEKLKQENVIDNDLLEDLLPNSVGSYYTILSNQISQTSQKILKNGYHSEMKKQAKSKFDEMIDLLNSDIYIPNIALEEEKENMLANDNKKLMIKDKKMLDKISNTIGISANEYNKIQSNPSVFEIFKLLSDKIETRNNNTLKDMDSLISKIIEQMSKTKNPFKLKNKYKPMLKQIEQTEIELSTNLRIQYNTLRESLGMPILSKINYKKALSSLILISEKRKKNIIKSEKVIDNLLDNLEVFTKSGQAREPRHIKISPSTIKDILKDENILIENIKLKKRIVKHFKDISKSKRFIKKIKKHPSISKIFYHLNKQNEFIYACSIIKKYISNFNKSIKTKFTVDELKLIKKFSFLDKEESLTNIPHSLKVELETLCRAEKILPPKPITLAGIISLLDQTNKNKDFSKYQISNTTVNEDKNLSSIIKNLR